MRVCVAVVQARVHMHNAHTARAAVTERELKHVNAHTVTVEAVCAAKPPSVHVCKHAGVKMGVCHLIRRLQHS